MSDSFRLEKLTGLLSYVVRSTGMAFISTPMDYYYSIGIETTVIDDKIADLRALIRDMEIMTKNPLSLQYGELLGLSTGDNALWKNNFYRNDVLSLCLLPEDVRLSAYTVYFDEIKDLRLLKMLADNTNAEAMRINVEKRIVVPFFPTVTKLFLIRKYHDITAYLDTLVELTVSVFDLRYYQFMIEAKRLQYINMDYVSLRPGASLDPVNIENICKVLKIRRETSNLPLLGFRFCNGLHNNSRLSTYIDKLMKELRQHRDLEVLEIPLFNVKSFSKLMSVQRKLKTLAIVCNDVNFADVMLSLDDKVPKLDRIRIRIDESSNLTHEFINTHLASFVYNRPNMKELIVSNFHNEVPSDEIKAKIEGNVIRGKKLGDSNMLKEIRRLVIPLDERTNFLGSHGSLLKCTDVAPRLSTQDDEDQDAYYEYLFGEEDEYKELVSVEEIENIRLLTENTRKQREIDAETVLPVVGTIMSDTFDPDRDYIGKPDYQ